MNKHSFFVYYLNKTGGKYDPRIVVEMIEALKEWLPPETGGDGLYSDGWSDYREEVLRNLK